MSRQIMIVARNAVTKKIINPFGNTITITNTGTETFDDWGESVITGTTTVSTVGVFDGYYTAQLSKTSAGLLSEGQSIVILKYDETVDENYIITNDGVEYRVIKVSPIKEADILVAIEVIVERLL